MNHFVLLLFVCIATCRAYSEVAAPRPPVNGFSALAPTLSPFSMKAASGAVNFCGTGRIQKLKYAFSDRVNARQACGCQIPALQISGSKLYVINQNEKAMGNNATSCEVPPPSQNIVAAPARLDGIDDDFDFKKVTLADQKKGKDVLDKLLAGIITLGGQKAIALTLSPSWSNTKLHRETIIAENCPLLNTKGCRGYSVQLFLAGPENEPDIHLFKKEQNGVIMMGHLSKHNRDLLIKHLLSGEDSEKLKKQRVMALDLLLAAAVRHEQVHERDLKGLDHAWERALNSPRYSSTFEFCEAGDFASDKAAIHKQVVAEAKQDLKERTIRLTEEEEECSRRFHEQEYKPGSYVKTLLECLQKGGDKCKDIGTDQMPKPIYDDVPDCNYSE